MKAGQPAEKRGGPGRRALGVTSEVWGVMLWVPKSELSVGLFCSVGSGVPLRAFGGCVTGRGSGLVAGVFVWWGHGQVPCWWQGIAGQGSVCLGQGEG